MGQLLFKKEFFPAIRQGRKITTLRRWKYPRVIKGEKIHSPGLGPLHILAVDTVDLKNLTDADAQADGFSTMALLRAALDRFYPNQKGDGKRWYRVRFQTGGAGHRPPDHPPTDPPAPLSKKSRQQLRLVRKIRAELDKAVRRSRL